jgi:uncharacterized paraquat-inducible protein A
MGLFRVLSIQLFGAIARGNAERKDREELERVRTEPCPECGRYNPITCRVCPRCTFKLYKLWQDEEP